MSADTVPSDNADQCRPRGLALVPVVVIVLGLAGCVLFAVLGALIWALGLHLH